MNIKNVKSITLGGKGVWKIQDANGNTLWKKTYTITLSGDNCTFIGAGTYDAGTTVEIRCTPNDGYSFVQWSDGNTNATRSIVVTDNITLSVTVEAESDSRRYFYVEDTSGSSNTLQIAKSNTSAPTLTVYYSTDKETWTSFTTSTTATSITVPANGKVYLKCTTSNYWGSQLGSNKINCTGYYKVGGNIMSLLYGDDYIGQTTLPSSWQFYHLFYNSTKLTNASNLVLPATTLTDYCYYGMFSDSGLTTAPSLPATTLATSCYEGMFSGCNRLTTAPELPATNLASGCYYEMFSDCTRLTILPSLPATTLASSCYYEMFSGCTALTTVQTLPATTLASYCYNNMFLGCINLTTAPSLPATTLTTGCYEGMFSGCNRLTTAPELNATILAERCYNNMFYNCRSLNYIKCLATDRSATDCTSGWVSNVADSGIFVKASNMNDWTTGINGIPTNWEVRRNGYEYYTITLTGDNCTLTGAGTYEEGTEATIECVPGDSYRFTSWNDGNTENPRTITVNSNITLEALCEPIVYYTITLIGEHCTFNGEGTYEEGTEATIECIPDEGFEFIEWEDTNTDNPRTITVNDNITLNAGVAAIPIVQYSVTLSGDDSRCSLTGDGVYEEGTEVMIECMPFEGYVFVEWSDGNTDNPRTLTMDQDYYLSATVDEIPVEYYTITLIGDNCTFNGEGEFEAGTEVSVECMPDPGYTFTTWDDGITENPRMIIVDQDYTLTATVEAEMMQYSVTLGGENCTLTGDGVYDEGTEVMIECVPDPGYEFVEWSDGNTENPRTLTMDQDYDLTANTQVLQYTITLTGNNCTLTGAGTYDYGTVVSISCVPNSGYTFTSWSDGNTSATRSITVNDNITLSATVESSSESGEYFYIKDTSGSSNSFKIKRGSSDSNYAPSLTVYYSTNKSSWTSFTTSTSGKTITIPANGKVYLKCTANRWAMGVGDNNINTITCSNGNCDLGGNIMSLLYGDSFVNKTTFPSSAPFHFAYLFKGSTKIINASRLAIPVTTMTGSYNYNSMFYGCTSLTTAPELNATTLATGCYDSMFKGCTSLTTVPELNATTLTNRCYQNMFNGCTSLTTAPSLPATTLASRCYYQMFYGCTRLTTPPQLPATTLADYCYYMMFYNCSSLTTAPQLPATTLTEACYNNMFNGCTSLNYIKCLATNISATGCTNNWVYNVASSGTFYKDVSMIDWTTGVDGIPTNWTATDESTGEYFYVEDVSGNSNTLQIAKNNDSAPTLTIYYSTDKNNWNSITTSTTATSITIPASSKVYLKCTTNSWRVWSEGWDYYNQITCSGNYKVSGNIMSLLYGDNYNGQTTLPSTYLFLKLFSGSSTLTDASKLSLPATTLTNYCYEEMFYGCTRLTTPPSLPATTLTECCYSGMFYGCTSLTTAPKLNATTLSEGCYGSMFWGCTSLTTAPELKVTTLADSCYSGMFGGCTFLITPPSLPATTLTTGCYSNMFYGCTRLTTAPELNATTLTENCYKFMFDGCSKLNYIKCLATDISATDCTSAWVRNVASSGTFYKDVNNDSWTTGVNGIPDDWTVEDNGGGGSESEEYFYIEDASMMGNVIDLRNFDCYSIQYSYDKIYWQSGSSSNIPIYETGGKIYFKMDQGMWQSGGNNRINCSGNYKVGGNIMSLLYGDDFIGQTTLPDTNEFQNLFSDSTTLTDASKLSLPATTLTTGCYSYMFSDCTSLETAPELPATSLTTNCYNNMFNGCTSLNYIKCLGDPRGLSSRYTSSWVNNVSSSGTFVKASGSTWSTQYNSGIPYGWTVLEV